jgi:hypothetical protein
MAVTLERGKEKIAGLPQSLTILIQRSANVEIIGN